MFQLIDKRGKGESRQGAGRVRYHRGGASLLSVHKLGVARLKEHRGSSNFIDFQLKFKGPFYANDVSLRPLLPTRYSIPFRLLHVEEDSLNEPRNLATSRPELCLENSSVP